MKRTVMYFAGAAAVILAALGVPQPANALQIADGNITFSASSGKFTVDNGHISLTTSSVHVPSLAETFADGNFQLVVSSGAGVAFSGSAHAVPNSAIDVPENFTVAVSGLVFTITAGHSEARVDTNVGTHTPGFINETYIGTLTNGASTFITGTDITLSATCTENVIGSRTGPINCAYVLSAVPAPEPASLVILASLLLGFGLVRCREWA